MSLKLRYKLCFLMLALSAIAARGQITNLLTYTFDDGQVPFNTALTPSGTAGINPGLGVTNGGGLNNSGLLKLTIPASGQTFGH